MPSPPAKNIEALDDGSSQVPADCLRTPLILRLILDHFPCHKLRKLSLVNKQWNHEARSLLRYRGRLVAVMEARHPCRDIKAFASDLHKMNIVPFSGIDIELNPLCHGSAKCIGSLAKGLDPSVYELILNQLRWKHLSVGFPHNWELCQNCPAFLLVKKILDNFSDGLFRLSLVVQSNRTEFIQRVLPRSFSSLKALQLLDGHATTNEDYTVLIKTLVSRAPKLDGLGISGPINLGGNLLEGSSAILVTNFNVSPSAQEISDNVLAGLSLGGLELRRIGPDMCLARINRITPMLLQRSVETLSSLDIEVAFLAPLMCYRICLSNVRDLELHLYHLETFQPRVQKLVREFDFTRIFPRLTYVQSFVGTRANGLLQAQIHEMIEGRNPLWSEPMPNRAVNIKSLRVVIGSVIEHFPVGLLPAMLPHIEKLTLASYRGELMPGFIWDNLWADLKDVIVWRKGQSQSRNVNLDSVFCGIYPQEVAELREKDEEYLNAVNIVPVMPSFVSLKGLRTFTLIGDRAYFSRGSNTDPTAAMSSVNDPAHLFSKVTGLVAFKRCPAMTVTLKTTDSQVFEELNRMKPYARVVG